MNMKITPAWRKNALSLKKKILRRLEMNRSFVPSSSTQAEESVRLNIPGDHNGWKTAEIALLEAERKKTEALIHRYALIR
jgi:hypothetical protein